MVPTKRHYFLVGTALLLASVLVVAATTLTHRANPITVPQLTPIQVTLDQALSSDRSRPGDHFDATVSEPVVVDGKTVIPDGAHVEGLVVDSHPSGRLRGRGRLQLVLQSVEVNGKSYDIRTDFSRRSGGSHKKRNIAWIAGSAGGGALIGALAGGGKGALIGGPVGAGAGTAAAWFTGKKDIKLSPETRLTFRLSDPVTIPVKG